jgi:hypothetical protein
MEVFGLAMTPEHLFFIPGVLFLGMVIGFLIGQSFKIREDEGPRK